LRDGAAALGAPSPKHSDIHRHSSTFLDIGERRTRVEMHCAGRSPEAWLLLALIGFSWLLEGSHLGFPWPAALAFLGFWRADFGFHWLSGVPGAK
jgi:hypothetical protein